MLHRKDYKAISDIIRKARENNPNSQGAINEIAFNLSEYFREDNPMFDDNRFEWACNSDKTYKSTI